MFFDTAAPGHVALHSCYRVKCDSIKAGAGNSICDTQSEKYVIRVVRGGDGGIAAGVVLVARRFKAGEGDSRQMKVLQGR